jgi:2-oxoglutarate ferredoxin oxidoreductase subunit beta
MREHEAVLHELDFVPYFQEITVDIPEGEVTDVEMHDGSHLRIRKLDRNYDPTNRLAAGAILEEAEAKGEVLTGVLYVNPSKPTFVEQLNLVDAPIGTLPESQTRPSREVLEQVMEELR